MFSTNSSKICCSFEINKIVEKSKMAAKMRTYCENAKSILRSVSNFGHAVWGRPQILKQF